MTADVELLPCGECGMPCRPGEYHPFAACLMFKACHNSETVRANLAPLQAENERLREALAALKAENETLRTALKDADNELDWLDEDVGTCDHSIGVCTCSYWNMRRNMKATLSKGDNND